MLIDRSDRTINICEMKFYEKPYSITKSYADVLRMKMVIFAEATRICKALALTMVTTYGIPLASTPVLSKTKLSWTTSSSLRNSAGFC